MTTQELIKILENQESYILAIDGMCASGKSTFAAYLQERLGGQVFHMDDFFLPIEKRTKDRLSEPGGNVDYERFLETVLKPLSQKQTIQYQSFDCTIMDLQKDIQEIPYHSRNIVEGSYALHPFLLPYYTHVILLKVTPQIQLERLRQRNPQNIFDFQEKWIPLENYYFESYHLYETYPVIESLHIL